MLHTLDLQRFRGFEKYRLSGLAQVNLLVGKNNCRKTSVLEAVELLVSEGHPRVLHQSLQRRGERGSRRMREPVIDVAHIFHGHACAPGASFELSSEDLLAENGNATLKVEILSLDDVGDEAEAWEQLVVRRLRQNMLVPDPKEAVPAFGMTIDMGGPGRRLLLPVLEDRSIGIVGSWHRLRYGQARGSRTPVHFLTLDTLDPAAMGNKWNTVQEKRLEAEIISDMKIMVPNIDSIHFPASREQGGDILIGLEGSQRRLPIGTYGDGTRRFLALRLSFVGTENGVLLIDEIDTGLHWTIMEEMWQVVVEVASRLNVQVFATTHSLDCIRGLGSLLRNHPNLEQLVSLQKMTRLLPEAVCLQGDQIRIAVEQDMEVR